MKIYNIIFKIYIVFTLFAFAFMNIESSTIFDSYSVFNIPLKVVKIHFAITCVMFVIGVVLKLMTNSKFKFDVITFCLFIKIVADLFTIVIFSIEISSYMEFFSIGIATLMIYFLIINNNIQLKDFKFYKVAFIIFILIICFQVFQTGIIALQEGKMSYNYKSALNIPYGGSNIIAAILCPMIALVYVTVKNKYIKFLILTILLLAVVLTYSRGGMILAALSFLFFFLKGNKKIKKIAIMILLFPILFIVLNEYIFEKFDFSFDGLSSSRLKLIKNAFSEYHIKYFVFGTGMQTVLGGNDTGVHCFPIDVFLKCGIVGLAVYSTVFYKIFKLNSKSKTIMEKALFYMIVIILINSLFEVCYFSYKCDILLWLFIGLFVAFNKKIREVNNYELSN